MKRDTHDADRSAAAFYPYGSDRHDAAPGGAAASRLYPGSAEVRDGSGRTVLESYVAERAGRDWLLSSQLPGAPARLLAQVSQDRLPDDPLDAAAELLADLWSLRDPRRLRFVRSLQAGALGPQHWRRIEARIPGGRPLEQALRAEGHRVATGPGPIGTTEHILLLRRA